MKRGALPWVLGLTLSATAVALGLGLGSAGCSKKSKSNPVAGPGKFNLGPFGTNQSIGQAFPTGEVDIGYHCIPHVGSGMIGTVHVRTSFAGPDPTVQIGTGNQLRFFPDTITVRTGGTVTWHNNSSLTNHTVTQD